MPWWKRVQKLRVDPEYVNTVRRESLSAQVGRWRMDPSYQMGITTIKKTQPPYDWAGEPILSQETPDESQ